MILYGLLIFRSNNLNGSGNKVFKSEYDTDMAPHADLAGTNQRNL